MSPILVHRPTSSTATWPEAYSDESDFDYQIGDYSDTSLSDYSPGYPNPELDACSDHPLGYFDLSANNSNHFHPEAYSAEYVEDTMSLGRHVEELPEFPPASVKDSIALDMLMRELAFLAEQHWQLEEEALRSRQIEGIVDSDWSGFSEGMEHFLGVKSESENGSTLFTDPWNDNRHITPEHLEDSFLLPLGRLLHHHKTRKLPLSSVESVFDSCNTLVDFQGQQLGNLGPKELEDFTEPEEGLDDLDEYELVVPETGSVYDYRTKKGSTGIEM
ncbi:hypothetical protein D9758_010918 [Tetrapyrgos nigripes]|uniref:Uncharacterized protein n=1 Tax=Tetrapyrgos nigripes TaxID=182062 RepID=A0A8H5FTP1_9AGAR|nr:hypothetical protein D9758_010918 [Tetrapyrgos nigripes]